LNPDEFNLVYLKQLHRMFCPETLGEGYCGAIGFDLPLLLGSTPAQQARHFLCYRQYGI
jgi:hypothetical protein